LTHSALQRFFDADRSRRSILLRLDDFIKILNR
jgi:hypothetical protein